MMEMATFECEVVLFMMSLCWGSALHPAMETEILDDTQRGRSSAAQVQSCPVRQLAVSKRSVQALQRHLLFVQLAIVITCCRC